MSPFVCRLERVNTLTSIGEEKDLQCSTVKPAPLQVMLKPNPFFLLFAFFNTNKTVKILNMQETLNEAQNKHDGDGLNATMFLWLY